VGLHGASLLAACIWALEEVSPARPDFHRLSCKFMTVRRCSAITWSVRVASRLACKSVTLVIVSIRVGVDRIGIGWRLKRESKKNRYKWIGL
jgi:hypothetical protein